MDSLYNPSVIQDLILEELRRRGRGAQTRLAEAVGVRVQTVNKWRFGQTTPEPDKWPLIEDHFGWPEGHIARESGLHEPLNAVDLVRQLLARGLTREDILRLVELVDDEGAEAVAHKDGTIVVTPQGANYDIRIGAQADENFAEAAEGGPTETQGPSQHRPSPPPEPEGP